MMVANRGYHRHHKDMDNRPSRLLQTARRKQLKKRKGLFIT